MCKFLKQGLAIVVMAVAAGLWCLSASSAKPPGGGGNPSPSYRIVKLDSADGLLAGGAESINNAGLIVGGVLDPISEENRAACWTLDAAGGTVTSTLYLLNGGSAAYGVNDSGEIVGEQNGTAIYWANRNATAIVLPDSPAGSTSTRAIAINENGVICGWTRAWDGLQTAVVWRININPVDSTLSVWGPLPLPAFSPDHHYAAALSDNAGGVARVAGGSLGPTPLARTWLVRSQPDGSLGVTDGPITLGVGSADGVNDAGLICGQVHPDAVVWDPTSGTWRILDKSGTITIASGRRAFDSAEALAINTNNAIAGYASAGLHPAAVAWPSPTASMIVLDKFLKNTAISELNYARAVNDFGYIVGSGWDGNRKIQVGFLAIPN